MKNPIIKPLGKILSINDKRIHNTSLERFRKYTRRGYNILPRKLVLFTLYRCKIM